MRIAWEHVHHLDVVARDFELDDLIRALLALLDQTMTLHHDEELPLAVVPVLSLGDARLADVDAHLSAVGQMHQLSEGTSLVHVHLHWISNFLFRKIREIRGIQLLREASLRYLRNHQGLGLFGKTVQQIHNLAQLHMMSHGTIAILAFFQGKHAQTIKVAAMLLALQGVHHLRHQVVNIEQLQFHTRVIDGDRQVIGDVVTESGYRTIIIRSAPLAEKVREAIYQYTGP